MGFSKMLELLQQKNKGYIILANAGAFYLARGKDAVKLNEILGLKLLCIEPEVCKIGIPVNSIETYMKKIEEKEYSYIVYYFNQQTNRLEIIKKYTGKNKNTETKEKLNCYICQNTVKVYKKPDKYIEAIAKLYEEENNKKQEEKKEQEKGKEIDG